MLHQALLALRAVIAFTSYGYIHPDEYFQNGEPLLADTLSLPIVKPWEFDTSFPCRSMASVKLFGLPLMTLSAVTKVITGNNASGYALFITQRLTFFLISIVVDLSLPYLVGSSRQKENKRYAILAYASLGTTLTFSIRPFSNSIEAAILCLCLVLIKRLHRMELNDAQWKFDSLALGVLWVCGIFSRFTFAIFAFPQGLMYLWLVWQRGKQASGLSRIVAAVKDSSWTILGACITAMIHIGYDTWYYASSRIVVTPLNALQYNRQTDNLALHGLHPKWLHSVVNAPMILGVVQWTLVAWIIASFMLRRRRRTTIRNDPTSLICMSTILLAMTALSSAPHQEARFLLPLVIPSIVLVANNIERLQRSLSKGVLRLLISLHVLQSVSMVIFFGYSHQAGIVPALMQLNQDLRISKSYDSIHTWRTFMPPAHLLLPSSIPLSHNDTLVDHGSSPIGYLINNLSKSCHDHLCVLITPTWALDTFPQEDKRISLDPVATYSYFPHLDMDHLDEIHDSFRKRYQQQGKGTWNAIRQSLSLQVVAFNVTSQGQTECLIAQ
ncbi:unnamed protein product [Sympodiomycopsis kandeliae]